MKQKIKKLLDTGMTSSPYSIFNIPYSAERGFAPTPIFASLHRVFSLLCLSYLILKNDRLFPAYGNATKTLCKNRCRGFGMVEMLIGASIFSIALFSISNFFQVALRTSGTTQASVQGDYLLEEGMEAVKIFRDMGYTANFKNMSTTTTYYFSWNGTNWATTTTNTFIDGKFERKFTLADVKRDANSDIASSGTYDPDIKRVTVSVAWHDLTGTTTHSIQTYVTNIFNN